MGIARHWRVALACLVVLTVLAPAGFGPATALSPPACNEATGIAATDEGEWILTSWDHIELRDGEWEEVDRRDSPGQNNTYGVARGPNGSYWLLQGGGVVNMTEELQTGERVDLDIGNDGGATLPEGNDLAYAGRWLVLFDGEVTTYNESWGDHDPDPPVEDVVPEDTRGLYAMDDMYAFLTADGTVEVYERVSNESLDGTTNQSLNQTTNESFNGTTNESLNQSLNQTTNESFNGTTNESLNQSLNQTTNESFEHRETVSLDVSHDVVDLHPGPNGTLLILHPGNVTAVTGDGERIDHRTSVFAPEGCDVDSSGAGESFAYLALLVVGAALVFVSAVVLATVLFVKFLRG